MPNVNPPEQLESYLKIVRENLRGLPDGEISEIEMELRSHVLDSVGGDPGEEKMRDALSRLGEPREVARINLSMRVAAGAAGQTSPLTVTRTIARLAGLSVRGMFTLVVSLLGYGFAASWLVTAVAKPFAPDHVGLWLMPDASGDYNFSLGRHDPHFGGHDALGWWIIPIGLVVGFLVAYLTYRFDLHAIRKMARASVRLESTAS